MVYLSVISYLTAILYFYVGFNAVRSNKKSEVGRAFFLLTMSMAIWSFAFGFVYLARNVYQYSFWNKISAFGWCTFEALVLYFVFVLTECKFIRHWYTRLLVMLPAGVFLYMVLFLFGPDIDTSDTIRTIFNVGNFIYNFSYLIISIFILYLWGRRSNSKLQKKQADIIAVSGLLSFLLNLFVQHVLPLILNRNVPYMGQLLSLIMLLGVNYAIMEYQFLSIPTSLITNELFNELNGLTLLVDLKGYISKANKQVNILLGYQEEEICGKHISIILNHKDISEYMQKCEELQKRMKFMEIDVLTKTGSVIPFNMTVIPLHTRTNLMRGLLFIGEDIRVTKRLQNEIIEHKLTNEKLQNSEMLFRTILEIAPIAILLVSTNLKNILYLNTQAEKLLGIGDSNLVGSDVSIFFTNPKDQELLAKNIKEDKEISKNEIELKKQDGTEFTGLISAIPSIYHDEKVILCCIIDMTEHKRAEETLKKKNEYIVELNKELMEMNNNLMNKSIRDGLTNLYNHQHMNEILEEKLQEIENSQGNVCLMMIDIDHFKLVNDKFGHLFGDKVLAAVADLIVKNTRNNDYIGRYGGEEFIVILPEISLEPAAVIAEKIRKSVLDHNYGKKDLTVTISIGVAQFAGETANALINKADKLLYRAKSNGRNRVEKSL